jgi:hypothetical protein
MLNNADDDYLTSMAIGLFVSNRKSKKFRNMENKGGVLNGDFIKKHLERETQLEDKIFELEERIKNITKTTEGDTNPEAYYSKDSVYYTILQGMIPYMSISLSHEDEVIRVTVDDCPINDRLAKYLESLRREYSEQTEKTPWHVPVYNNASKPHILKVNYFDDPNIKVTAAPQVNAGLSDNIDIAAVMPEIALPEFQTKYGLGGKSYKNFNWKFR